MSSRLSINHKIKDSKKNYLGFINTCRTGEVHYSLTPSAEPTPFARCFAIFGLHLIGEKQLLYEKRDQLIDAILWDMTQVRSLSSKVDLDSKEYKQLLCFSLSALSILNGVDNKKILEMVAEQIPQDISKHLEISGSLDGVARSGNAAMFVAIFLEYMRLYGKTDTSSDIDIWVSLHKDSMNKFGFWGVNKGPTHLHFQNGYHQYEIFEYLDIKNDKYKNAMLATASLADPFGHFAPYPGGGGCFDYDAIFLLTPFGKLPQDQSLRKLVSLTFKTLLSEQLSDGGFCESLHVRPRNLLLRGSIERLKSIKNLAQLKERTRYAITLHRSKHNLIHTHWSRYSRRWNESNLWDSWFRMLTIARITFAMSEQLEDRWGFINFPGIGWHPSCRFVNSDF